MPCVPIDIAEIVGDVWRKNKDMERTKSEALKKIQLLKGVKDYHLEEERSDYNNSESDPYDPFHALPLYKKADLYEENRVYRMPGGYTPDLQLSLIKDEIQIRIKITPCWRKSSCVGQRLGETWAFPLDRGIEQINYNNLTNGFQDSVRSIKVNSIMHTIHHFYYIGEGSPDGRSEGIHFQHRGEAHRPPRLEALRL